MGAPGYFFNKNLILLAEVLRIFLELDLNSLQLWLSCWRFLHSRLPPCSVLLQVQPHGTSLYCSDLLDDTSCVALLVVGFLLLTPLLVLALAAYCRLARHLQLGMCFIPYSRAVYKNLPATRRRGSGAGGCCGREGASEREGKGSVWVWEHLLEVWIFQCKFTFFWNFLIIFLKFSPLFLLVSSTFFIYILNITN